MDEVQAAMSVVEGYAEHVMDAIAAEFIPDHEGLRDAMDRRRRSRSAPQRLIERLLGFDVKLRQYEQGKKWADAVAARGGHRGAQPGLGRPRRRCPRRTNCSTQGGGSSAPSRRTPERRLQRVPHVRPLSPDSPAARSLATFTAAVACL